MLGQRRVRTSRGCDPHDPQAVVPAADRDAEIADALGGRLRETDGLWDVGPEERTVVTLWWDPAGVIAGGRGSAGMAWSTKIVDQE